MDPKYQKFDSKLRINNVQTEDGGVYQCFVTLDGGKQIQSSGELRLGGKAHVLSFTYSDNYVLQLWFEFDNELNWLFIARFRAFYVICRK